MKDSPFRFRITDKANLPNKNTDMNTTDHARSRLVLPDLTPHSNHDPRPVTEPAAPAQHAEGNKRIAIWKAIVRTEFDEDGVFTLIWICSLATLIVCFLKLL